MRGGWSWLTPLTVHFFDFVVERSPFLTQSVAKPACGRRRHRTTKDSVRQLPIVCPGGGKCEFTDVKMA